MCGGASTVMGLLVTRGSQEGPDACRRRDHKAGPLPPTTMMRAIRQVRPELWGRPCGLVDGCLAG